MKGSNMKATLEYIEDHSPTIKTFWFNPDKPVDNVAGQYTEVYLPHKNPDKRGQKRWFTIYSSPTEDLLAITTKITPKHSSFKQALLNLSQGMELQFTEPMGDFILPVDKSIPLVFVAGGIGVTPFRSIIKWLSDKDEKRDIQLLYASHDQSEFIEQKLFEQVPTKYIVSQPSKVWTGLSGQLTTERILNLAKFDKKTHVFLSGPEPMIEVLNKELVQSGQPKHQVITDYFPGYIEL